MVEAEAAARSFQARAFCARHSSGQAFTQDQNRTRAIEILKAKLYKKREGDRKSAEAGFYVSKTTDIEWGNQIRSYVLHPYKMIKDARTGYETSNVNAVLDGDLDDFMSAMLSYEASGGNRDE